MRAAHLVKAAPSRSRRLRNSSIAFCAASSISSNAHSNHRPERRICVLIGKSAANRCEFREDWRRVTRTNRLIVESVPMSRAHFETASKSSVQILLAAAALALPFMRLQAQPAVVESGLAGYEVACTIEDSSGSRICEQAPVRSCNADAEYASQPSQEPTDMTWVNRG